LISRVPLSTMDTSIFVESKMTLSNRSVLEERKIPHSIIRSPGGHAQLPLHAEFPFSLLAFHHHVSIASVHALTSTSEDHILTCASCPRIFIERKDDACDYDGKPHCYLTSSSSCFPSQTTRTSDPEGEVTIDIRHDDEERRARSLGS